MYDIVPAIIKPATKHTQGGDSPSPQLSEVP